jgi:hypothetical protein
MSKAPFMFTTTSSVLILVLCPNLLVVWTRRVQWHQHESPAPPARNFTADSDKHRFMLPIKREFICEPNQYDEFKDILSSFISLHFKDCKFITGLKGGIIDAAIYISVHCFSAIWVFVVATELCDKEL